MNRYRWDPRLVGQRYFPSRRRSRCGSVPVTRHYSKGRTSGSLNPPRRQRFSCSPYKPTSYSSQQRSSLDDIEPTHKDMKVPSTSDAHILDHMRCSCSACMSFACKWRHLMKDEFRRRVKSHRYPRLKPHRKTSFHWRQLKSQSCTDNFRKKWGPSLAQRDPTVSWLYGNYDPDSVTKGQDLTSPESPPFGDKPDPYCFNNSRSDLSARISRDESLFDSIDRAKNRKVTWNGFNEVAMDGTIKDTKLVNKEDDVSLDAKSNDDFWDNDLLKYKPNYEDWYYPGDTFSLPRDTDRHWCGRIHNYDFTRPTDISCNSVAFSDDHYGFGNKTDFGSSFLRRNFGDHLAYRETGVCTSGVGAQTYHWDQPAYKVTEKKTRDWTRPCRAQTITLHNPGASLREARLKLYKVQDLDDTYRAAQKEDNLYCTHIVQNGQYKAAQHEESSTIHFSNECYKTKQHYDLTNQFSTKNQFRPISTQRDQSNTRSKIDEHMTLTQNDTTNSEDRDNPSRFSRKCPGKQGHFSHCCRACPPKENYRGKNYSRIERYTTPTTQSDCDESSQLDSNYNLRSKRKNYGHANRNVHSRDPRSDRKLGVGEVRLSSDEEETCHHHHYHHHHTGSFPRALRLNYDFRHRHDPSVTRDYRRPDDASVSCEKSSSGRGGRHSLYDRSRCGIQENLVDDSQTYADKHGDHRKSSNPIEPKSDCKLGTDQEDKQTKREEPLDRVKKDADDCKAKTNNVVKKFSLDFDKSEMPVRRFSIDRNTTQGERPSLQFDRAGTFIITENDGDSIPQPGHVNASNHKSEQRKPPIRRLSKKGNGQKKMEDQKKSSEKNSGTPPKQGASSPNLGGRLVDLLKTIIGQGEKEEKSKNDNENTSARAYTMSGGAGNETKQSGRLDDTRQKLTDVDVNSIEQFEEETYVTARSSLEQGRSRGNASHKHEWHSKNKKESPERMPQRLAQMISHETQHANTKPHAIEGADSKGQSSKCKEDLDEKPIRIDNVLRRSALKQDKKKRTKKETHRPDCKSLGNKNLNRKSSSWDELHSDESDSTSRRTQRYKRPFRRNPVFGRYSDAGSSSQDQSRIRRPVSPSLSEVYYPTHISRREKSTEFLSPSRSRDVDLTASTPERGAPCVAEAPRQITRLSPSPVSLKHRSLCASTKVLSEPMPRSEDEWFNKHSSLMTECTKERQANAQARVDRIAHRTQALKDSMGTLTFDFGEMEKRLDKVRDLQHDYLARANRAVRMVRKQHFSSPECQRPRGNAGDTRRNTRLQGTSSDGKLYRHRNLDELYSYFISNYCKTDSESPNHRSTESTRNQNVDSPRNQSPKNPKNQSSESSYNQSGWKKQGVTRRNFDAGLDQTITQQGYRKRDKTNYSGNNIYYAKEEEPSIDEKGQLSSDTLKIVDDFRKLGGRSVRLKMLPYRMSELNCDDSSAESWSDTVSSTRRLSGYEPDIETDKEKDFKHRQDPQVTYSPYCKLINSLNITPQKGEDVTVGVCKVSRHFPHDQTEDIVAKIDKTLKNDSNRFKILLNQ